MTNLIYNPLLFERQDLVRPVTQQELIKYGEVVRHQLLYEQMLDYAVSVIVYSEWIKISISRSASSTYTTLRLGSDSHKPLPQSKAFRLFKSGDLVYSKSNPKFYWTLSSALVDSHFLLLFLARNASR